MELDMRHLTHLLAGLVLLVSCHAAARTILWMLADDRGTSQGRPLKLTPR